MILYGTSYAGSKMLSMARQHSAVRPSYYNPQCDVDEAWSVVEIKLGRPCRYGRQS